jgi:hypothetical protein
MLGAFAGAINAKRAEEPTDQWRRAAKDPIGFP